jgi:hypothetical protein
VKFLRRLGWAVLTLLAGAAWVALWIFLFSVMIGSLGYQWASFIQFWGVFVGLFWLTLKSLENVGKL